MDDMKRENPKGKPNEEAFKKAVIDYRERIYLLLLKYVRNREDAKDLTQEAFIKAYNSLGSFRQESGLYTWIYRIAVNLAINFKTRDKTLTFQSIEDVVLTNTDNSIIDNILTREMSNKINEAVLKLPKRQKMAFVLRYYEERPYAEISDLMGITEGAAKANYHQAVKRLKISLGSYLRGES